MAPKVKLKDKIAPEHRRKVAEAIIEEWRGRKERRKGLEKHWAEIDRQLIMMPELSHKRTSNGRVIEGLEWLPEVELPIQSQTLEMLMADTRRLKFPKNRDWFTARAGLDEKYLERYRAAGSPIPGEAGANPTELRQDDADRIAAATVSHWHSQYDFRAAVDVIDASAFTYTFGAGRLRKVRRRIIGQSAKQGPKEEVIPVLVPRDAKMVYLDDSMHAIMHEGEVVGPNIIQHRTVKYADVVASATNDDSYLQDEIRHLTADKNGNIELVELEGDIVVDVGSEVIVQRDVVATAATGKNDKSETFGLIRIQPGEGQSTYFISHYQNEKVDTAYGSAPLLKGMPVARICAQVMNRLLESAQLKNAPPIGYGRDDPAFAGSGGPQISPYAKFETTDDLTVYSEVGGDPGALFGIYQGLVGMYYDVVGVNPARLGQSTKSHTTAFAKDVEQSRGESRTLDYVNQSLEGWMTRLLEMEYRMGLKNWSKRVLYIEPWKEFAEIERGHLPDTVRFIANGAGSPAEEEARQQRKFNAAQAAVQLDTIAIQAGQPPSIDLPALIRGILEDGGWTDPSEITLETQPQQATEGQPGQLPGISAEAPEGLL
jgi:hypothetical protein